MQNKKKLQLKKITVSNLSDDMAKAILGGDDATTFGDHCTETCASPCDPNFTQRACNSNGCPSGPGQPNCTQQGCDTTQTAGGNVPCFTDGDNCTYGQCTDTQKGCTISYKDDQCSKFPIC